MVLYSYLKPILLRRLHLDSSPVYRLVGITSAIPKSYTPPQQDAKFLKQR
jgi:hypothetical protein